MRSIRFVQIGDCNSAVIRTLTDKMNSIQDSFQFVFDNDLFDIGQKIEPIKGEYAPDKIEKLLIEFMSENKYFETPIGITQYRLQDGFLIHNNKRCAIISIANWENRTSISVLRGLGFLSASVLIDFDLEQNVHEKTRCCPNDYCGDAADLDIGIKKSEFCPACKKAFNIAVSKHKLSLNDVIAVYKILDDLADRKYCFMIMPFLPEFEVVYKNIRSLLKKHAYICIRADEVKESRDILDIIIEQLGRSSIIIADLTGKNPNVFYELGYSHAMGKNTIMISQKKEDVPFDVNHIQYVVYDIKDIPGSLINRIEEYL